MKQGATTSDASSLDQTWFAGLARSVSCQIHADARGVLLPFAFDELPFMPCRLFAVSGVPAGTVRGGHGHRVGQQLLICLQGRIGIWMRRDQQEVHTVLAPGGPGLLCGPGVWCSQTYLGEGAVLLVLASEPYDPDSYVTNCD